MAIYKNRIHLPIILLKLKQNKLNQLSESLSASEADHLEKAFFNHKLINTRTCHRKIDTIKTARAVSAGLIKFD